MATTQHMYTVNDWDHGSRTIVKVSLPVTSLTRIL